MRPRWASQSTIAWRTCQELEGQFDLITCMEVIEHVADPAAFVQALAKRLRRGGLLILSTPNATGWSKLLMITLGEGLGRIPEGTHEFDKFIAPDRMKRCSATPGSGASTSKGSPGRRRAGCTSATTCG